MKTTRNRKTVVYACSGASVEGEWADRIARRLAQNGVAQMSCLAGVSNRVPEMMEQAKQAKQIFVIDGCPINCARNTLEQAGFRKVKYLGLHELGLSQEPGPLTEQRVEAATDAAMRLINI